MKRIYNYCGIVFNSNIEFPFFYEDHINSPDFEITYTNHTEPHDASFQFFFNNRAYILSFGDLGYYEISKNHMVCHFKDVAYMYATICNLPFAVIAVLRGLLPCHASSLVSKENTAVLIVGEKGAGKTTFACLADTYDWCQIYGDDMVTLHKTYNQLQVNRGSKLMKVTEETTILLDCNRISGEVYTGLNKKYYSPQNPFTKHNNVNFDKILLLDRGPVIGCEKIPDSLCKLSLARHIVGISILERYFSQTINEMLNDLNICNIYKLTLPGTLNDLKNCFHNIVNSIEGENKN